jgi:hypothetical protein
MWSGRMHSWTTVVQFRLKVAEEKGGPVRRSGGDREVPVGQTYSPFKILNNFINIYNISMADLSLVKICKSPTINFKGCTYIFLPLFKLLDIP